MPTSLFTRLRPRLKGRPGRIAITFIQASCVLHIIHEYIGAPWPTWGLSMLPTFHSEGTWVIVSPMPYWAPWIQKKHRGPRRGDLVMADGMSDPNGPVLKRVIGLEGDLIEVEPRRGDSEVTMGSNATSEESRILHTKPGQGKWVKVPKGHVWLAGDNLANSTDSRMYGPVPMAMVRGKVLGTVWPFPPKPADPGVRILEEMK